MTAVEQLIYDLRNIDMSIFNDEHCKKYLAMEKQQIIDAAERWKGTDFAEKYYNETYGGNHIVDTNEMVEDTFKVWECCGMEECECGLTPDELIIKDMHNQITSSQIEISDEEIIKLANEHILYNNSKRQWVIEGMKLYKEQLKRGNNE